MRLRGVIVLLAVSLLLLSGLSASRRGLRSAPTSAPTAAEAASPTPAPITADLPADGKVKAIAGQTINLRVHSDSPDVATISELGVSAAVGPGIVGELTVVTPTAGNFPVTLEIAQRNVGVLVVKP